MDYIIVHKRKHKRFTWEFWCMLSVQLSSDGAFNTEILYMSIVIEFYECRALWKVAGGDMYTKVNLPKGACISGSFSNTRQKQFWFLVALHSLLAACYIKVQEQTNDSIFYIFAATKNQAMTTFILRVIAPLCTTPHICLALHHQPRLHNNNNNNNSPRSQCSSTITCPHSSLETIGPVKTISNTAQKTTTTTPKNLCQ